MFSFDVVVVVGVIASVVVVGCNEVAWVESFFDLIRSRRDCLADFLSSMRIFRSSILSAGSRAWAALAPKPTPLRSDKVT